MKHATRPRRIVAALVAMAMVFSLCMPVLAESGAAQQTEPAQTEGSAPSVTGGYGIYINDTELTPDAPSSEGLTYDAAKQVLLSEDPSIWGITIRIEGDLKDQVDVQIGVPCYEGLTITGARNVTLQKGASNGAITISCAGDLLIQDDTTGVGGDLTVQSARNVTVTGRDNVAVTGDAKINCTGDLWLEGRAAAVSGNLTVENAANVTLKNNIDGFSTLNGDAAIHCTGDLWVENPAGRAVNGALTVEKAHDVTVTSGDDFAAVWGDMTISCTGKLTFQSKGDSVLDGETLTVNSAAEVSIDTPNSELALGTLHCTGKVQLNVQSIKTPDGQTAAAIGSAQEPVGSVEINTTDYCVSRDALSIASSGAVTINCNGGELTNGTLTIAKATDVTLQGTSTYGLMYNSDAVLDIACSGTLLLEDPNASENVYKADVIRGTLRYTPTGASTVLRAGTSAADAAYQGVCPAGQTTIWQGSYNGRIYLCAKPEEVTLYSITVPGGSAFVGGMEVTQCPAGETVQLKADSTVYGWQVKTGNTLIEVNNNNNTFVMPAGDVTVTAVTELQPQEYPYLVVIQDSRSTILDPFALNAVYDGGTYTLNYADVAAEGEYVTIQGVAAQNGTRPSLVLNGPVNAYSLTLNNLESAELNGTVLHLLAECDTEGVPTVGRITVNGSILDGSDLYATGDITVNGSIAADNVTFDTRNGNVTLDLTEASGARLYVRTRKDEAEVHITGSSADALCQNLTVYGKTLEITNKGGGTIGNVKVHVNSGERYSYQFRADGQPVYPAWDSDFYGYVFSAEDNIQILRVQYQEPDPTQYPYLMLNDSTPVAPYNVAWFGGTYDAATCTYSLSVPQDGSSGNKVAGVAATDGTLPSVVLTAEGGTAKDLVLKDLQDATVNGTVKELRSYLDDEGKATIGSLTVNGTIQDYTSVCSTGDITVNGGISLENEYGFTVDLASTGGNVTLNLDAGEQIHTRVLLEAPQGEVTITGSHADALTGTTDNSVYFAVVATALHAGNTGGGTVGNVEFFGEPGSYVVTADEVRLRPDWREYNGSSRCWINADQSGRKLTIAPRPASELTKPYLLVDGAIITPDDLIAGETYDPATATYTLVLGDTGERTMIEGVAVDGTLPSLTLTINVDNLTLQNLKDVALNGDVYRLTASDVNSYKQAGDILDTASVYAENDILLRGNFAAAENATLTSYYGNVTVEPTQKLRHDVALNADSGEVWITGADAESLIVGLAQFNVTAKALHAQNTGSGTVGKVRFTQATSGTYEVTADGTVLPVTWTQDDYGDLYCEIPAAESGKELSITRTGNTPGPAPDPDEPEQYDYPYLLVDDGAVTPENLDLYNGTIQYQESTHTYTLDFEGTPEGYPIPIEGVAAKDGTLPSVVLNNVDTSAVYLYNLNDVTLNGTVYELYAYPADASGTLPEPTVNSITVNGTVRTGAIAFAKGNIEFTDGFATVKLPDATEEYFSALYSADGSVDVTLGGYQLQMGLAITAPNGEVYITGSNAGLLTADNTWGISAEAKTLHVENEGGGKIGKVQFFATQPGDYVATADGEPLDITWGTSEDTGYVKCDIPAEQTGSKLAIAPKGTEPTNPDQPEKPDPDEPEQPADGGVLAAVVGVAAGGAVIWGGYELATRVILHNLLPEGAAIPATRAELVKLAWETAGKPEPAVQPAFADITDPELAKAAQWCVEQGMLDAQDGKFRPEDHIAKFRVIEAWKKGFEKN